MLILASFKQHFEVFDYLLKECSAEVGAVDSRGRNCMHWAAGHSLKDLRILKTILLHGGDRDGVLNAKDKFGRTPLDHAYDKKNYVNCLPMKDEVVALLRSHGGKANHHNEYGEELLDIGAGQPSMPSKTRSSVYPLNTGSSPISPKKQLTV